MATESTIAIVQDTREQTPLRFSSSVNVVRACLPTGDYAPFGFEARAAIERKSLADFVASVTRERARFWRELERLRAFELRAVVIEASITDAASHSYRSEASPRSVVASANAIVVDLGIPVLWAGTPKLAAFCVEWMFRRFISKQPKVVPT